MISFHLIKIAVIQRKQLIPLPWHQGTTFRQLPGTKSRLPHRVMNLCSNCWAQLTMDFLPQNKTSLRRSRNITSIRMTFTALMVLYCIRTALSYHHRYGRTYLISCTLPIRALAPCSQEQWKLFFGQVSPKLSMFVEIAVLTAIVIHLLNHMHHHTQFRSQATLFNVFVAISSIIKVPKSLLPLITIRTGPQLRWHMKTLRA